MSSDRAASALKWWQDAGVDTIVGEEARDWLNPRAPAPIAPATPAQPAAASLPDSLDAFQAWLLESDDVPFASPGAPRLGPSGDPASGLMILVDMPAPEDFGAGILLSGEAGALFDRMMKAIGRSRETLYLAALSPIRTASGSFEGPDAARLADIARHHIALVRPRALLLFGDACSKTLVGPAVAGTRGRWHAVETTAGPVRTLVTIRPEKLLKQPGLKKLAWEDLQRLEEEVKA